MIGHKARMWYLGPLIVLFRNQGGAYIGCKLDGTVWRRPVDLDDFMDVSQPEFDKLEASTAIDKDRLDLMDGPPDDDMFFYLYNTLNV
ncbi:hypothetical protein PQX77_003585 [Marasmius sp. AFHP31]|nr:hypothetical protein PQX77_003585 [Marasmius sp. AFHP31]